MNNGVCMYSPYPTGGMPLYVAELLEAMAVAEGEKPSVEWVTSADLDPRFLSDRYVVHRTLPVIRDRSEFRTTIGYAFSRAMHYVRREWRFTSWLRTQPGLKIVHFQEAPPAIAHLLVHWLRKRGSAIFFTVHNVRPHDYPVILPRALVDGSLRRAYAQSDCLFVHSQGLAAELEHFMNVGQHALRSPRICVVHHGVWTVDSSASKVDEETLARRLHERHLLFFGTIRRNKGLHLLLDSAVRGELDGFRITVAGEPGELDYLDQTIVPLVGRARAAGVRVELNAEFVPEDEIGALFATCSALVLPYTADFVAQSGAAFMGLAHGLPIVATRSGALGELMSGRHIGVTAASATAPAVAEAVRKLFSTDTPGVAELADGMRRAVDELGWNAMAEATIAEYRRYEPFMPAIGSTALPTGDARCRT